MTLHLKSELRVIQKISAEIVDFFQAESLIDCR